MTSTTILHGDVRTMRRGAAPAEAIAWRDGRILAVGTRGHVAASAGAATVLDVGTRTVLPGFVDAHHHAVIGALYAGGARLVPPTVTDVASLQAALAAEAARTPPGHWVLALDWNELFLRERRAPTRAELDDAVPDHPLFAMHYSCHRGVVNSRALALAGIDRHTAEPTGGAIERGPNREPSGVLIERGMSRTEQLARTDRLTYDVEGVLRRLAAHERRTLATGITLLVDAAVPPDLLRVYEAAHERGLARTPTIAMPVSFHGWLEEPVDLLVAPKLVTRAPGLHIGPLKMVFDGAASCAMCLSVWQSAAAMLHTVALSLREGSIDPIRNALGTAPRPSARGLRTGILMYETPAAARCVAEALEHGWSTGVHAEGNEAVEMVLDAYTAARSSLHDHGQARIEHAMFLERSHVERAADLGVAIVAQPPFLALRELILAPRIPGISIKPFRSLLDAGATLVGSSDFPVTTFDPWVGIRAAMQRPDGSPDEAIGLDEALAMYTRTPAEMLGVARDHGTLEPGKRADLLVLDSRLDERSMHAVHVAVTVLGGTVEHGILT